MIKRPNHHHHSQIAPEGEAPPLVDLDRRQLIAGLGLLPAALMLQGVGRAWALSNRVDVIEDGAFRKITSNAIPDHPTGQFPNGTYAYSLTETWPVIPRYFAGEPDMSFRNSPPGGGRGPGGPDGTHRRPPPPGGGSRPPPPGGRPPGGRLPWPPPR